MAFGDNGNVHDPTELFIVMSEKFSNPAFESIPANSITNLATDCNPQTRKAPSRIHNHNKMGSMITLALLPGSFIIT